MGFLNFISKYSEKKKEEEISLSFLNYYLLLIQSYQKQNINETEFKEELNLLVENMEKNIEIFPSSNKFKAYYDYTYGNYSAAIAKFEKAILENKKDWFSYFFKAKSIRSLQNDEYFNHKPFIVKNLDNSKSEQIDSLNLLREKQNKYLEEVIFDHKEVISILLKKYKNGEAKIIIEESEAQRLIAKNDYVKHNAKFDFEQSLITASKFKIDNKTEE